MTAVTASEGESGHDVAAVSWQVRLAVLKDAKLDVSKVPAK